MGDPGFTFYVDNFMAGTMFFSDEQVGRYVRAMCAQKIEGHLTLEQLNTFAKGDERVLSKFVQDEAGLYYNKRLDKEIKKRAKFSKSQSDKAKKKWHPENDNNAGASAPAHPPADAGLKASAINKIIIKNKINNKTSKKTVTKQQDDNGEVVCLREGKTVPAKRFKSYVVLTIAEYGRMIEDWGEKFTQRAIEEYDRKFPNSEAIRKKHTDHNRAIRDWVNRGYICQNLSPGPKNETGPPPRPTEEELGPLDERISIIREALPESLRPGKNINRDVQVKTETESALS